MKTAEDQFLFGGGVPSAKFPTVGTLVVGEVTEVPEITEQTDMDGEVRTWDDGKPRMQLVITMRVGLCDDDDEKALAAGFVPYDPELGTDDEGVRRLYVKGQLQAEFRKAVKAAGLRRTDELVGCEVTVEYVRDEKAKVGKKKIYEVEVKKGRKLSPREEVEASMGFGGAKADADEPVEDDLAPPVRRRTVAADEPVEEPRRSRRESRVTNHGDDD